MRVVNNDNKVVHISKLCNDNINEPSQNYHQHNHQNNPHRNPQNNYENKHQNNRNQGQYVRQNPRPYYTK
jgi:hypothetical protein